MKKCLHKILKILMLFFFEEIPVKFSLLTPFTELAELLSQYVSLANIFSGGEIPELEIVAYEKEDIDKLLSFMING